MSPTASATCGRARLGTEQPQGRRHPRHRSRADALDVDDRAARPVSDEGWGLLTAIALPGGVELGLYQPRHPTALPGP
jgi:hypothetical protein